VYSYSTDNRAWAEVCAPVVRRYDGVVGGFGVHQVSSGLYVSSSDHVSLSSTIPTPFSLWPAQYQSVTPTLYYFLVGSFAMLL
jgi:hypothetical protein